MFCLGRFSEIGVAAVMLVDTVHYSRALFTKLFLDFWFVARVRARADNVFKGNVNNREIVENTQNRINFIND